MSESVIEAIEADFDFSGVQEVLNRAVSNNRIDFYELLTGIVTGKEKLSFGVIWDYVTGNFFSDVVYNKDALVLLVLIGISAAVFANISSAFAGGQVAETAFYITYLLFISVVAAAFYTISQTAVRVLMAVTEFMEALVPSFFLSVGMVSGSGTSVMFYEITLGIITLLNRVLLKIVIPMIDIYVVLIMVNYLSKEDFLTKLAELVQMLIKWGLTTMFTLALGMNVIQGMILPVANTVKTSVLTRAAGMIPGIGSGANAIWETLLGTGMIIKNAIGMAAVVTLFFIIIVPVSKMALFAIMYHGAGALLQPISDKRINEALGGVCEGAKLLLKTVCMATVLFAVSVAIVCASTNGGL